MSGDRALKLLERIAPAALRTAGSRLADESAYLCVQQWLRADDNTLVCEASREVSIPKFDLSKLKGTEPEARVRRAIVHAAGNFVHMSTTLSSPWRVEIESLRRLAAAAAPEEQLLTLLRDQLKMLRALGERVGDAEAEEQRLQELASTLEANIEQSRALAERRRELVEQEDARADLIIGARIAGAQRRDDRSLLTILLSDQGLPPLVVAAVLGELAHQDVAVDLEHPNMAAARRNVLDRLRRAEKKAAAFLGRTKRNG